jgi:hypothetical protein
MPISSIHRMFVLMQNWKTSKTLKAQVRYPEYRRYLPTSLKARNPTLVDLPVKTLKRKCLLYNMESKT